MRTTDRRLRIEQRPSNEVHRRDYGNGPARSAPCRYCGRPTVEDVAFSAQAGRYLGYCHSCRRMLAGTPEPIEAVPWPGRRSRS
ncbi:MAG: hypothetical protein R6V58_02365 [Planctomycetota bacterium]